MMYDPHILFGNNTKELSMARPAADQSTFYIGITGQARVGKDTVASILFDELKCCAFKRGFDGTVCHYNFTTPIKAALQKMFNWSSHYTYGDLKDEMTNLGFTPRKAMQTLGTEWGRSLNKDLWIEIAKNNTPNYRFVIIPDVRYDNEADFIRDNGALIHVSRGYRRLADIDGIVGHTSERGVKRMPEDYFIVNQLDIDTLEDYVCDVLDDILNTMRENGQVV